MGLLKDRVELGVATVWGTHSSFSLRSGPRRVNGPVWSCPALSFGTPSNQSWNIAVGNGVTAISAAIYLSMGRRIVCAPVGYGDCWGLRSGRAPVAVAASKLPIST